MNQVQEAIEMAAVVERITADVDVHTAVIPVVRREATMQQRGEHHFQISSVLTPPRQRCRMRSKLRTRHRAVMLGDPELLRLANVSAYLSRQRTVSISLQFNAQVVVERIIRNRMILVSTGRLVTVAFDDSMTQLRTFEASQLARLAIAVRRLIMRLVVLVTIGLFELTLSPCKASADTTQRIA